MPESPQPPPAQLQKPENQASATSFPYSMWRQTVRVRGRPQLSITALRVIRKCPIKGRKFPDRPLEPSPQWATYVYRTCPQMKHDLGKVPFPRQAHATSGVFSPRNRMNDLFSRPLSLLEHRHQWNNNLFSQHRTTGYCQIVTAYHYFSTGQGP